MKSDEYKYRIDSIKQEWVYLKEKQASGSAMTLEELQRMGQLRALILKFV